MQTRSYFNKHSFVRKIKHRLNKQHIDLEYFVQDIVEVGIVDSDLDRPRVELVSQAPQIVVLELLELEFGANLHRLLIVVRGEVDTPRHKTRRRVQLVGDL